MKLSRVIVLTLAALAHFTSASAQNVQQQPTVIKSQTLDMTSTDTETTSIFTGNVVVTGTNLKLTCDRLEVVGLQAPGSKGSIGKVEGFKSLIATGNVRLIQGEREAACGRAIVLPGEDKLILQENPVLVDHTENWTYRGEEVELHRGERRVHGKNIEMVGPALKDLGVDKDKLLSPTKPVAPAEAPKQP
ncbi:LptA/OstA family protein [Oleiharenicola lentus]|uniref:LptA/OstA family protein n=1 Tax=Oleiharenicola lentus TaxID=2508720 RepID=UPI003F661E6B